MLPTINALTLERPCVRFHLGGLAGSIRTSLRPQGPANPPNPPDRCVPLEVTYAPGMRPPKRLALGAQEHSIRNRIYGQEH